MASLSAALSHTLFLFLICIACHKSASAHEEEERWPSAAPAAQRLRSVLLNQTDFLRGRRLTGSFQLCALCTCCGGPRGLCLPSPCCYSINCNIPNRPFGFCSFTPKTCNCFGCHL